MNINLVDLELNVHDSMTLAHDDSITVNEHLFYLVNKFQLLKNFQGNSCVKNRSMVRGGGAKPYKQKGTGRARQGTIRSPLKVGGGVIFGPSPRERSISLNKPVFFNLFRSLFATYDKPAICIKSDGDAFIKTSFLSSQLLAKLNLSHSVYFILDEDGSSLERAARNIKGFSITNSNNLSAEKLRRSHGLVFDQKAISSLREVYEL